MPLDRDEVVAALIRDPVERVMRSFEGGSTIWVLKHAATRIEPYIAQWMISIGAIVPELDGLPLQGDNVSQSYRLAGPVESRA